MRTSAHRSAGFVVCIVAAFLARPACAQPAAPLPAGVKAVWELGRAGREGTATRERVCINGLWRWQPAGVTAGAKAAAKPEAVPADGWGYFKVPGCWPGITDYLQ